jgi:predicted neutral ceramidase superfamily lipid hydrolase
MYLTLLEKTEIKKKDYLTFLTVVLFILILGILNLILKPAFEVIVITAFILVTAFVILFIFYKVNNKLKMLKKITNILSVYQINGKNKIYRNELISISAYSILKKEAFTYQEFEKIIQNKDFYINFFKKPILVFIKKDNDSPVRLLEGTIIEGEAKDISFLFNEINPDSKINNELFFLKRK